MGLRWLAVHFCKSHISTIKGGYIRKLTLLVYSHTPSHGAREVLIIFGALLSSDSGDIHQTISTLVADKIKVGIVGLAAQVAICRELCAKTNNESSYNVALHEHHFHELMMEVTTPSAVHSKQSAANSLLMMGFPSHTMDSFPSLCACHSKPSRGGYLCSRCGSKVCALPAECPTCGLTLILSTHLARSYHHLFPLINWIEVPWKSASKSSSCFACGVRFPAIPSTEDESVKGISASSRYECTVCGNHFCIDCDVFAHEIVHNCPGCQSGDVHAKQELAERMNGESKTNGSSHDADTMDVN